MNKVKHTYYQVFEYDENLPENKRRIYTFADASSAHDMLEFILKHDDMPVDLGVEEYETST
jgi:hypothetical protein